MIKKALDYVLGSIYLLYFGAILCIFHVIQVICFNVFGKKAHQASVNALNFFIVYGCLLTGSSSTFKQEADLPSGRPLIFVANHRSLFDIPGMIWFLRKHTPLFVSKIELSKGIPSISYNLRNGGAALIDRKDGKSAVVQIAKLARYIHQNGFSAAIFPEGTRSRIGKMKAFSVGGVATLVKRCPDALIVPVAIDGTGSFNPKGLFPLTSFTSMSWTTLQPIEPNSGTMEEVVLKAEQQIANKLGLEVDRPRT
ncbi:1-acyl-sn-glycerol-3-phosphate acyltransferase [Spirosomataceae bacterium TFI 002]|nr:1-acyl-sn-glycerol-3-phosphate acyltransferase [Spirosomataceae bacterium TFI 002]